MNSIPCNIVLLPTTDLAQKAIQSSQKLEQFGSLFTLKDGAYFPHASLYMTQLKTADLDTVKELLAHIAAQASAFDLSAVHYYQAHGYIDVEYNRTALLDQLQIDVIEAINPIRDGMREKDTVRMRTATDIVLENFQKYGYPNVGELFRPHMTLTRFSDGESKEVIDVLPPVSDFGGQFVKLGLFEMGDNGTCIRKISEFEL